MENKNSTCPGCNHILPDVNNMFFCPYCALQLKCKICNELLVQNATVCVNCGTPIKTVRTENTNVMNEFDYEQKGDNKKLKSRFTNEVGSVFAETIGMMIGGSFQLRKTQNPFISPNSLKNNTNTKNTLKLPNTQQDAEEAIIISNDNYNELLTRHFQFDDDKLKLINSRLKQSGKLDHAIRLALLTLYSYDQLGQSTIEKSVLAGMLSSSNLYDTHFQSWLAKCDEIIKDGTKLQLSVPGKEVVIEILNEILDDTITKGNITFSKIKSGKRTKKKSSDNNIDSEQRIPSQTSSPRKKGLGYYLNELVKEGYFRDKRKIGDIIEYLKVNKAETYPTTEISTPLKRMIKSQKLKREKNSDGQYEYFL